MGQVFGHGTEEHKGSPPRDEKEIAQLAKEWETFLDDAADEPKLEFTNGACDDYTVERLQRILKNNTYLTNLSVEKGGFSSKGLVLLCEALKTALKLEKLDISHNHVAENLKVVCELIGANHTLRAIDLADNELGNDVAPLADVLKTNRTLQKMTLGYNGLGPIAAMQLAEALKVNTGMTDISFKGNEIGDDGARALAAALLVNKTLLVLRLTATDITDEGMIEIAGALKTGNRTLTSLKVCDGCVTGDGVAALAEALEQNSVISSLYLCGNTLGDDGVNKFKDSFRVNTGLTYLDLGGTGLTADFISLVGLKTNTTLVTLDLTRNEIQDAGAEIFAETIRVNTTLNSIRVAENGISSAGAAALCHALAGNTTITLLDLSDNNIGARGAAAVGDCLRTNSGITQLLLPRNMIGDGVASLMEGLRHNHTLKVLNLTHNFVLDAGAKVISDFLRHNSTLERLDLADNKITQEGAIRLAGALRLNSSLAVLVLAKNKIRCAGMTEIVSMLRGNTTLLTVIVTDNDVGETEAVLGNELDTLLLRNATIREPSREIRKRLEALMTHHVLIPHRPPFSFTRFADIQDMVARRKVPDMTDAGVLCVALRMAETSGQVDAVRALLAPFVSAAYTTLLAGHSVDISTLSPELQARVRRMYANRTGDSPDMTPAVPPPLPAHVHNAACCPTFAHPGILEAQKGPTVRRHVTISGDVNHGVMAWRQLYDLHGLSEVEELVMANCNLEDILDGALRRLLTLGTLNLSHNSLRQLTENIFAAQQQSLTTLDLSANKLSAIPPAALSLPHLSTLNLMGNQIRTLDPAARLPPSLTVLDLAGNHISVLPETMLEGCTSLVSLLLQRNYISTLPNGFLCSKSTGRTFRNLNLSFNRLRELPPSIFEGQYALQGVDFSFNNLATLSPLVFDVGTVPRLLYVNIAGNLCRGDQLIFAAGHEPVTFIQEMGPPGVLTATDTSQHWLFFETVEGFLCPLHPTGRTSGQTQPSTSPALVMQAATPRDNTSSAFAGMSLGTSTPREAFIPAPLISTTHYAAATALAQRSVTARQRLIGKIKSVVHSLRLISTLRGNPAHIVGRPDPYLTRGVSVVYQLMPFLAAYQAGAPTAKRESFQAPPDVAFEDLACAATLINLTCTPPKEGKRKDGMHPVSAWMLQLVDNSLSTGDSAKSDEDRDPIADFMEAEFAKIVGVEPLKNQLRSWYKQIQIEAITGKTDQARPIHMAFVGQPGVGKTTIAKLTAKVMARMGLRRDRPPVIVNSALQLTGSVVGESKEKVMKKVEEAREGILMIDEAYMATDCPPGANPNPYGVEVVNTLMELMMPADGPPPCTIILCGYRAAMDRFYQINQGMKPGRIRYEFDFPNYTLEELCAILPLMARGEKFRESLGPDVVEKLPELIRLVPTEFYSDKNARAVEIWLERAQQARNDRIPLVEVRKNPALGSLLLLEDIEEGFYAMAATDTKYGAAKKRAPTASATVTAEVVSNTPGIKSQPMPPKTPRPPPVKR